MSRWPSKQARAHPDQASTSMRASNDSYDLLHRGFRWKVPSQFNLFEVCCARWARSTPQATALICEHEQGDVARFSYADLHTSGLRLAAALAALGVVRDAAAAGEPDPGVFGELALLDAPSAAACRAEAESVRNGRRP